MPITRDDWLTAYREATEAKIPPSDAVTLLEFGALMGLERSQAGKRMRVLVDAGKATITKKAVRRSDGWVMWVPAYHLVKPTQSGKDRTQKRTR